MIRVGVVGARGYVGGELLPRLARHPEVEVTFVTSSSAVGAPVQALDGLTYVAADPQAVPEADAWFLALPNGQSAPWVEAAGTRMVIDLSTDHRFDADWVYAQPERFGAALPGARRLAVPGCYATAAQLAAAPLVPWLAGPVHVFGLSGTSGAGTTKSERNDPDVVRDNVVPYALTGHAHERELAHHLAAPVFFMPHVAPFFRGLCTTVSAQVAGADRAQLEAAYHAAYDACRFVELTSEPPRPRDSVGRHDVRVGGLSMSGDHVVVVAALDNLLAGAASQALRAFNRALGVDEALGL